MIKTIIMLNLTAKALISLRFLFLGRGRYVGVGDTVGHYIHYNDIDHVDDLGLKPCLKKKKQVLNKNCQNLKRFYLLQVRLGDRGRRVESEGGRAPKKVGTPFE